MYKLIGNKLLLTEIEAQKPSNLIIPDTAKQSMKAQVLRCRVEAVGVGYWSSDGKTLIPCHTKVGDEVLVPSAFCPEIELEGTKYIISTEDKIVGIVET